MPQIKILAFAGSLRSGSFNKRLVDIAAEGARAAGAETTVIDLRDFALPIFDEDFERENPLPGNVRKLKDLFLAHHGLLIATPEYNSSVSAALKNVIDWVSRPTKLADGTPERPLQCFEEKIAGLLAASPGALGGLRGLPQLRYILSNIKVTVLADQFALMKAHEAFNADGSLKDPKQQEGAKAIGAAVAKMLIKLRA